MKKTVKGIDEIPIFSWNTSTKEFEVLGHKFEGINSIEDFINYIYGLDKENKRLYELVMYSILPKRIYNHELAADTKEAFIKIIKDNLNEETVTIRTKIEEYWDNMGNNQK